MHFDFVQGSVLVCCGGVALARISSLLPDLMKEKIPNSAKSLSHWISSLLHCIPIMLRSVISKTQVLRFPRRSLSSGASQRGPVTFVSLAITALVGGAVVMYYNVEKEEKMQQVAKTVVSVGKPALGGPWVLVDQNGKPRSDASYRGRFTLLYFGFTYCPDICPSELIKVAKIMNALGKRSLCLLVSDLIDALF